MPRQCVPIANGEVVNRRELIAYTTDCKISKNFHPFAFSKTNILRIAFASLNEFAFL